MPPLLRDRATQRNACARIDGDGRAQRCLLAGLRAGPSASRGLTRSIVSIATFASLVSGCADQLPVVATGRWIEMATKDETPICGGTVAYLDTIVEAGFGVLGETPPDDLTIRYEWRADAVVGTASGSGSDIVVRTSQLVEEHELAHAVHLAAWPKSNDFMHEGLAILFDSRRYLDPYAWPDSFALDDLIGPKLGTGEHYNQAWFLVSQIVRDHGFDGLRDLWHDIPEGSSPQHVRDAYRQRFGQPIETLLEPVLNPITGGYETRYPCLFSPCGDPDVHVESGSLEAPGPSGCVDDPTAVGPFQRPAGIDPPPVWKNTTFVTETTLGLEPHDELSIAIRPCFLRCDRAPSGNIFFIPGSNYAAALTAETWRVEIHQKLEALPTDDPGAVVLPDLEAD